MLLCPWNFPGKNIEVGCYFLFQGIFWTQGSNPCLLHCRQILYTVLTGTLGWWCPLKKCNPKNWAPYSWETSWRVEQAFRHLNMNGAHGQLHLFCSCFTLLTQMVDNLPAMQGMWEMAGLIPGVGKIPWRRKWQPFPVFLPGESHGQRNLAGCGP